MTTFQFYQNRSPPSLDEVLYPDTHNPPRGPYDRDSFIHFLNSSHCIENFEFVTEIDTFISHLHKLDSETLLDDTQIAYHSRLAAKWASIYYLYLHSDGAKEINVPKRVVVKFSPDILPDSQDLNEIRNMTYELLMVNFKDFLSYIREYEGEAPVKRRKSVMVAPETVCSPQYSAASNENVGFIWPASPELTSRTSDDDANRQNGSRSGSAGTISTRTSSRGSSMGSIFDSIKEHSGFNKTMQILRTRRASSERHEHFIH